MKLKGVVSLVLDLNHQRCTVRVVESVSATDLASAIYTETNMEAQLVCKNSYGQEVNNDETVLECVKFSGLGLCGLIDFYDCRGTKRYSVQIVGVATERGFRKNHVLCMNLIYWE